MSELTAERLRELLDYDADTGAFTWKVSPGRRVKIGSVAGTLDRNGYRRVGIDRRYYFAHRLVWLHVFGQWPADEIDHVTGSPDDNRLINLREAAHDENMRNYRLPKSNTSGLKGACWCAQTGRWQSNIRINGRATHLGRFDTAEEAHVAYCMAAIEHHGDFAGIPDNKRRRYTAVLKGEASLTFRGWIEASSL